VTWASLSEFVRMIGRIISVLVLRVADLHDYLGMACVKRNRILLRATATVVFALLVSACSPSVKGWAGLAVASDAAYVISADHRIFAVDLKARSRGEAFPTSNEWRFPSDSNQNLGAVYASPVLADGKLYVASFNDGSYGRLTAVDTATGRALWQFPPQGTIGSVAGSPLVRGDTVYVGSGSSLDHQVYALNASTGAQKWRFETKNKVWAGVATDGQSTLYVASLDHNVYALDMSGNLKWTFETLGAIASTPLYADGVLYFGSSDGKLYALNGASGEQKWAFDADSWMWGTPLLDRSTLFVGSLDNRVFALDAASGKALWAEPARTLGPVSATPVKVAGLLAVADQEGRVYGLDPATGEQKWVYVSDPKAGIFAQMVAQNDMLYVMPLNDRLISIDARSGSPVWVFRTGG